MVVSFVQPVADGPFGPGFGISLDSDFIGPLPADSYWLVWVATAADPETAWQSSHVPTVTNAKAFVWGRDQVVGDPFVSAVKGIAHGETVSVTASLQSPGGVIDEGSQTVTWDMISGVPMLLQRLITTGQELQVDASVLLAETNAAVHMDFGALGRFGLGELVDGVPTLPLTRQLITPDRSGEGTLDRPGGLFDVNAFGLTWEFVSRPAWAGTVIGAPDRAPRRVLDLQLQAVDAAANEYTRSSESFNEDRLYVTFNPIGLKRVAYWIEPGTLVRFWWLLIGA